MTDIFVTKVLTRLGNYALMPSHQSDLDVIKKLPYDEPVRVKVTRMRNVGFHRLYFALLNFAYDNWEPPENHVGEKNFDRFRSDIIILCGFYDQHVRLDGSTRLEPKSISFANMDQDQFEELYEKTIDVICKHVLVNYDGDDLKRVMGQLEEF